jgi:hypothetical protein
MFFGDVQEDLWVIIYLYISHKNDIFKKTFIPYRFKAQKCVLDCPDGLS